MSRYEYDIKLAAWTKECSCCKTLTVGVEDEDQSFVIFQQVYAANQGRSDVADGLQSRCWVCNSAKRRDLGITLEWLRDMHQKQGCCCGICGVPISLDRGSPNPANVDHDHKTNAVRQLLCGNCNRGLGIFFESPDLLRAAADYLEFHKEPSDG